METDPKIEAFLVELEAHSAEFLQIIQQSRALFKAASSEVTERFIYGGIGFYMGDDHIGGVYANKKHVNLAFARGNELTDPNGHLDGKGKFRRQLKLVTAADLASKEAENFVQQIISLAVQ